jgi:transcriptional regulator with XRE-family HTH domain
MATVETRRHRNRPMTPVEVRQIRKLRYQDGFSQAQIAAMVGCAVTTVRQYAPGLSKTGIWKPGKIDNAPLREAFLTSGLSAGHVAKELGWLSLQSKLSADGSKRWQWWTGDVSRVRRALGLADDVSHRNGSVLRSRRTLIDAEVAGRIAEAVGVAPWSVGCND